MSPQPYPAYKPSGVEWLGDVPAHWEFVRLKRHLLLNDSGVWGDDFDNQGTVVLRSTEQTIDGGWRISNPAKILLSPIERDSALLEANDLVLTKSSGSTDHIGKTSIVTPEIAAMNCCFSNFMQRIRLDAHVIPLLIWYIFNSSTGREQLKFQSTTTTGLGNLNGKIIGNCYIPLPPLPEQRAIVRYLDHVDDRIRRYISAKERLIALLEEERQAVIHRAVTRGLDPNVPLKPSGVEWLGDVPAHWEVRRLKEAATIIAGQSPPSAIVSEFLDNFPFLQGNAEFGSNHPTPRLACERPPKQAMAGDILLSVRAPVGALNFANRDYGIGRGLCAIRSRTRLHRRLTYYSLGVASQELLRLSTGSTYDAVTVGTVGGLNIPLPPLPEQTAIVEHIDNATANIDAAIARARRQIDLLREYRTRLIADVVTGKLDVREAAAELPEGVGQ